jgi:hypothetical protein
MDEKMKTQTILKYTIDIYKRNFFAILLAAIPGLMAIIIPILINFINKANPIYLSLGGVFLRAGRILDMTLIDGILLLVPLLLSTYMLSLAIVLINFIVKTQRTLRKIKTEELRRIGDYTNQVFVIYLAVIVLDLFLNILFYNSIFLNYILAFARLIIAIFALFVPSAIVIDDERIIVGIKKSYKIIKTKKMLVLQWILFAFLVLSFLDYLLLTISNALGLGIIGSIILALINFLVVMPFLIVMLTQIYISKYSILV